MSPAMGRRVAACCKIQARRTRDRGKFTVVPASVLRPQMWRVVFGHVAGRLQIVCSGPLFTAYAIVRTEPSANRPNRRKKKRSTSRVEAQSGIAMMNAMSCTIAAVRLGFSSRVQFARDKI